jgi:hypothetical protein
MDKDIRKRREYLPAVLIGLFASAFVIAATAAIVTTIEWRPMTSTSQVPPNGTPGSAQPGTIGLARPHPPMPVR